jgi:hypothetical protein
VLINTRYFPSFVDSWAGPFERPPEVLAVMLRQLAECPRWKDARVRAGHPEEVGLRSDLNVPVTASPGQGKQAEVGGQ